MFIQAVLSLRTQQPHPRHSWRKLKKYQIYVKVWEVAGIQEDTHACVHSHVHTYLLGEEGHVKVQNNGEMAKGMAQPEGTEHPSAQPAAHFTSENTEV